MVKDYYMHDGIPLMYVSYADLTEPYALVEQKELSHQEMQLQRAKQAGCALMPGTWHLMRAPGNCMGFIAEQEVRNDATSRIYTNDVKTNN